MKSEALGGHASSDRADLADFVVRKGLDWSGMVRIGAEEARFYGRSAQVLEWRGKSEVLVSVTDRY
jgi:hypothetical protein